MNEQAIEDIKNALREMMQLLVQRGNPLTEELKIKITEVLEHSANRIMQLRESEAQNEPTEPESDNIPPETPSNPPSPDAQLLWILAGQQPQAFISYLRTYPTPATQALLTNPTELNQTIDFLSRMMPQGEDRVIGGIPHADLNSSNVWGANYDQNTGKMKVRFQGGSVYEYDGIPKPIFDAFIHGNAEAKTSGQNRYGRWWRGKNPSLGAALNQYVKAGGFNYRRIH